MLVFLSTSKIIFHLITNNWTYDSEQKNLNLDFFSMKGIFCFFKYFHGNLYKFLRSNFEKYQSTHILQRIYNSYESQKQLSTVLLY